MSEFPLQDLLNYHSCYEMLAKALHPFGYCCPCCGSLHYRFHKTTKTGLPVHQCKECKSVFNLYTGTLLQGIHYDCKTVVLFLRGILKGETTLNLHKELKINYKNALEWRHCLQELAYENRWSGLLCDKVVESDEVFINAGNKGIKKDVKKGAAPARVRGNKKKALATGQTTVPLCRA